MEGDVEALPPPSGNVFHNIDAKLDNNLQLKSSASYRELTTFLRDYKSRESGDSNIIDQGLKIAYCIPEKLLPRFFILLEKCRSDKLILNFSEKQLEPSGLMLDFDILQEGEDSQLSDASFYKIARVVFELISTMIPSNTSISTHAMILRKSKTEYKDEDKCFKDGFHVLIPGIRLTKIVKKYIIKRIIEENLLDEVFSGMTFRGDVNSTLDKNSAHVVTLFPGNCKNGKTPYDIYHVYSVELKLGRVASLIQVNLPNTCNVVYEFSVNWPVDNGIVKKAEPILTDEIIALITQWSCKPSEVTRKLNDDLSILNLHDPDSDELRSIIDILSVDRCEDYKHWFSITCALAYMNERYKLLALHFSGKRPKGVRIEFERVWTEAVASKKYAYSKDMIYNYAKQDNPEAYMKIVSESVFMMLINYIFDQKVGGYVDHWHIAMLLHKMVGSKFAVDFDEASRGYVWHEFVLEDDPHSHGEIYKWRSCKDSHALRNYISAKVPILFGRAIDYLADRKNKSEEEEQIKYYNALIKVVIQSSRKLYNHGFKTSVIMECESIFRVNDFTRQLDKEENIMGVGNGILVFDKVPLLIASYHPHRISRYSSVNYRKLDPTDTSGWETACAVFKSIWDLFPDGERDAFHYIMFFLCTSLTGRMKACIFLTLKGGGANGKSYLMELVRNLLGGAMEHGYGCKLPIQFLTERDQMSTNANPVLVPLKWARLTYFSESDKSEHLRVAKKKMLTSHEPLPVRALYGNQENIMHKSNFILQTNYALTIDTTDHGTWRRERFYTMKIKFCANPDPSIATEKKDDPSFTTKKASNPDFLSGVLAILTVYLGILDMKYRGDINMVPCPTIIRETEEFRNSQDLINKYIKERIVVTVDKDSELAMADLVDNYCLWYEANVRDSRHDRRDISFMFENSRLGDHIIRRNNRAPCFRGRRAMGPGEEKHDCEHYMLAQDEDVATAAVIQPVEGGSAGGNVPHVAAITALYNEFSRLANDNQIEFW